MCKRLACVPLPGQLVDLLGSASVFLPRGGRDLFLHSVASAAKDTRASPEYFFPFNMFVGGLQRPDPLLDELCELPYLDSFTLAGPVPSRMAKHIISASRSLLTHPAVRTSHSLIATPPWPLFHGQLDQENLHPSALPRSCCDICLWEREDARTPGAEQLQGCIGKRANSRKALPLPVPGIIWHLIITLVHNPCISVGVG